MGSKQDMMTRSLGVVVDNSDEVAHVAERVLVTVVRTDASSYRLEISCDSQLCGQGLTWSTLSCNGRESHKQRDTVADFHREQRRRIFFEPRGRMERT
jgi:hypothetical protein